MSEEVSRQLESLRYVHVPRLLLGRTTFTLIFFFIVCSTEKEELTLKCTSLATVSNYWRPLPGIVGKGRRAS